MSKVMVNESSLTSIGNAIREKKGTTTKYKPSEMAAAISSIVTGSSTGPDFSALQYAEMTSNALIDVPDLSVFTNDFSKVVLLSIQSSGSVYLYLKGTDSEVYSQPEIFFFGASTYSTPYDEAPMFYLNSTAMNKIQIKSVSNDAILSRPFKGKIIMYYEGE